MRVVRIGREVRFKIMAEGFAQKARVVVDAEHSHSHRGFSPVTRRDSPFLNRFSGLKTKPLKRLNCS